MTMIMAGSALLRTVLSDLLPTVWPALLRTVEAYRKIARELRMRHLIVVLGLKLYVYRCLLARAELAQRVPSPKQHR